MNLNQASMVPIMMVNGQSCGKVHLVSSDDGTNMIVMSVENFRRTIDENRRLRANEEMLGREMMDVKLKLNQSLEETNKQKELLFAAYHRERIIAQRYCSVKMKIDNMQRLFAKESRELDYLLCGPEPEQVQGNMPRPQKRKAPETVTSNSAPKVFIRSGSTADGRQPGTSTSVVAYVDNGNVAGPANNDDDGLEQHKECYGSPMGWYCVCGRNYASRGSLLAHIRHKLSEPIFDCGLCSKKLQGITSLRTHHSEVHRIQCSKNNRCSKCGDNFPNYPDAVKHFADKHLAPEPDVITLDAESPARANPQ